jgi:uncharacterized membrane protein
MVSNFFKEKTMSAPSPITTLQSRTGKVVLLLALGILFAILTSACGTRAASNPPANAATPAATTASGAPAATSAPAASGAVSFAKDILPILQSRCVSCHGGDRTSRGLDMTTYDKLIVGSQNGAVITASDANNSLLIQMIQQGKMPKNGPKVTPGQLQMLIDWINAGALNN